MHVSSTILIPRSCLPSSVVIERLGTCQISIVCPRSWLGWGSKINKWRSSVVGGLHVMTRCCIMGLLDGLDCHVRRSPGLLQLRSERVCTWLVTVTIPGCPIVLIVLRHGSHSRWAWPAESIVGSHWASKTRDKCLLGWMRSRSKLCFWRQSNVLHTTCAQCTWCLALIVKGNSNATRGVCFWARGFNTIPFGASILPPCLNCSWKYLDLILGSSDRSSEPTIHLVRLNAEVLRGNSLLHKLKTRITIVFIVGFVYHILVVVAFVINDDGFTENLFELFGVVFVLSAPFDQFGETLLFNGSSCLSP